MITIRTRLAFITAALAATSLAACLDPGDVNQDGVDESAYILHPEEDVAGAQIRAIEGIEAPITEAMIVQTPGMDVSSYQGNVNWSAARNNGAKFAYIKATEGTSYQNPYFGQQYLGSYHAGIIRGAYHFALPNLSSGTAQADFFVNHGGGWSKDGKTLPPAIDLEYNPYGSTCYGKTHAQMVMWIHAFVNRVKERTGRDPVIYTSTNWWTLCTGNSAQFSANPLWIPRYGSSVGALPGSWSFQTIWQNADHGVFPGDHNYFNGAYSRVEAFAE